MEIYYKSLNDALIDLTAVTYIGPRADVADPFATIAIGGQTIHLPLLPQGRTSGSYGDSEASRRAQATQEHQRLVDRWLAVMDAKRQALLNQTLR